MSLVERDNEFEDLTNSRTRPHRIGGGDSVNPKFDVTLGHHQRGLRVHLSDNTSEGGHRCILINLSSAFSSMSFRPKGEIPKTLTWRA